MKKIVVFLSLGFLVYSGVIGTAELLFHDKRVHELALQLGVEKDSGAVSTLSSALWDRSFLILVMVVSTMALVAYFRGTECDEEETSS